MKGFRHISNIFFCLPASQLLFMHEECIHGRMMNRQAVNLINSFNLEFNQQLNELVTMETFPTHCLHTCSLLSTCDGSERKQAKKSLKIVQIFDIFSIDICRYGGYLPSYTTVYRDDDDNNKQNISYFVYIQECILHYYFSPLENCRMKKRISNEYLIEHSALQ